MRASLDGLSFDGSIVLEIKCPLSVRDLNAAQQGRVPSHYYGQLQHQLEVSGAGEAHYWSYDGRVGRLITIRPDREYLKRLVDEEGEFWRRVKENRWPELDDKELDMSSDPGWRSVALQYRQAKARLDAAAAQERKLRIILDRMATARRTFGCGVEVLKSFRRGTVDFTVIPQLSGVDLETFRKPKVAVTKINVIESTHEVSTSARVPF
jgi:predicted phage-related endonuclease